MSGKVRQYNSTLSADPAKALKRTTELRPDPEQVRRFNDRARKNSKMGKTASGRPKQAHIGHVNDRQREWARSQPCLGCGAELGTYVAIDFAHLTPGALGHCGSLLDGIPLCRMADGSGCHRRFDQRDPEPIDLLKIIQADWGRWASRYHHALWHTENPVLVIERLAGARTQWSELSPAASSEARETGVSA